jgi:Predicted hydrolase of the metallo-beta-lactamase superfamily
MKDIAIIAVGGYNEIGRNMTAIRIGKDIVVMDMGIRLDRVQIHEDTDVESLHAADLINIGAIPDDSIMENVDGKSGPSPALMVTSIISEPYPSWLISTMLR